MKSKRKRLRTLVKMEINIPDNEMAFLEAFSKLTGKPVKEMVQEEFDCMISANLGNWSIVLGVTQEELEEKYGL